MCNGMADAPETHFSPCVLSRQIWSFYVKGCRHSLSKGTQNLRWNPALGMGAWLTPKSTLLPHMCYRTEFGHSKSNRVRISRVPKICVRCALEPRLLGMERNTPLPIGVTTPNLVVLHQTVVIRYPQSWGALGPRAPFGTGTCVPHHVGYPAEFYPLLVKRYEHTHGDPPEKTGPSRPAVQGHSRSSELAWIDRVPMSSF